jgi:hypothetical protein
MQEAQTPASVCMACFLRIVGTDDAGFRLRARNAPADAFRENANDSTASPQHNPAALTARSCFGVLERVRGEAYDTPLSKGYKANSVSKGPCGIPWTGTHASPDHSEESVGGSYRPPITTHERCGGPGVANAYVDGGAGRESLAWWGICRCSFLFVWPFGPDPQDTPPRETKSVRLLG